MPSKHKFYEYYTLGCLSVRTESLALCVSLQFLLTNGFLVWLSIQGWHPYWRLGLPALFNVFAALTLLYAWWTDKPSYCLCFLIINGISICAIAVGLAALFLTEVDPKMVRKYLYDEHNQNINLWASSSSAEEDEQFHPRKSTHNHVEHHPWMQHSELGFLLLLLLLWISQGIVCHFWRYAKLRKAERYERSSTNASVRGNGFQRPPSALRRLQHIPQIPNAAKY